MCVCVRKKIEMDQILLQNPKYAQLVIQRILCAKNQIKVDLVNE